MTWYKESQFDSGIMPEQEPYDKERLDRLYDLVGGTELDDSHEKSLREEEAQIEAKMTDGTINGVPYQMSDNVWLAQKGIKIVNIVKLLNAIAKGVDDYQAESQIVQKWVAENDAHFYGRPKDGFSMQEAVTEAKNAGKEIVVIEDIS